MSTPQTNVQPERIGTLQFDAGGSDDVTVRPQRAPILGLLLTVSNSLDNGNTSSPGSQNDLGVAKLLKKITLRFNGTEYVAARGTDLFEHQHPFLSADGPLLTRVDPTVASSDFEGGWFIPLMPQRVLSDPFRKVHWPGLAVPSSGFKLEAEFESERVNSNSDPGTGALADGGTDAYSFGSDPDVKVHVLANDMRELKQVGAQLDDQGRPVTDGQGRPVIVPKFPEFAPRIKAFSSEQISSGSTPDDVSTDIPGRDVLMMVTMREIVGSGTTSTVEDLADNLRVGGDDDELPEVDKTAYRQYLIDRYEGVGRTIEGHDAPRGVTPIIFSGDGKLGGALRLAEMNDPTVTADIVNAPSGNDGRLRFVKHSLVKIPGATTGSTVGQDIAEQARRAFRRNNRAQQAAAQARGQGRGRG